MASRSIIVKELYFRYGQPARLKFDEKVREKDLDYIITACISNNDPFSNFECKCSKKCRFPPHDVRDALVRVWLRPKSSDVVDNSFSPDLIDPFYANVYLLEPKEPFYLQNLEGSGTTAMEDMKVCIICEQNNRTHAFVPCGHYCFCVECARLLDKPICPLCKKYIENAVRIFEV